MPKAKDALEILDRLTGGDPELRKMIEQERVNARMAWGGAFESSAVEFADRLIDDNRELFEELANRTG